MNQDNESLIGRMRDTLSKWGADEEQNDENQRSEANQQEDDSGFEPEFYDPATDTDNTLPDSDSALEDMDPADSAKKEQFTEDPIRESFEKEYILLDENEEPDMPTPDSSAGMMGDDSMEEDKDRSRDDTPIL